MSSSSAVDIKHFKNLHRQIQILPFDSLDEELEGIIESQEGGVLTVDYESAKLLPATEAIEEAIKREFRDGNDSECL